jgi:mRNA-degrading endonuclease toxin of MazEF toxin-antitoxin module
MKRGDVVLVDWVDSNLTLGKRRPAVVVQADFLNSLIANTVLVQITKTIRNASTEVSIDPVVETGSGLKFVSVASCNNYLTVRQTRISKMLGSLSAGMMQQIDSCLKTALELT